MCKTLYRKELQGCSQCVRMKLGIIAEVSNVSAPVSSVALCYHNKTSVTSIMCCIASVSFVHCTDLLKLTFILVVGLAMHTTICCAGEQSTMLADHGFTALQCTWAHAGNCY